jgi:hypothetical protein
MTGDRLTEDEVAERVRASQERIRQLAGMGILEPEVGGLGRSEGVVPTGFEPVSPP